MGWKEPCMQINGGYHGRYLKRDTIRFRNPETITSNRSSMYISMTLHTTLYEKSTCVRISNGP